MLWTQSFWTHLPCIVIAIQICMVNADELEDKLTNENAGVEERTYIFTKSGQVKHKTVENHEDLHNGSTEALIQAWEARNEILQEALKEGKGGLDPLTQEEINYQRLREDVMKETHGDFFDPDVEASKNENSTSEVMTPSDDQLGRRKRIMGKNPLSRWPKAIIPFNITEEVLHNTDEYKRAMAYIEENTCIRFVQWTDTINEELGLGDSSFLRFTDGDGCWSYEGNTRWGDGQAISCCGGITCVHELGHAMGLAHDNQSPLRDGWIRVNPQNVNPEYLQWYSRLGEGSMLTFDNYDLSSIMHYKKWTFSTGGPTMTLLFPELFLADSDFYMFMEVVSTHKCHEKEVCSGFSIKCENDGYVSVVRGKCACRCPTGLDPDTGCTTPLKKVRSDLKMPRGQYALLKPETGCPDESFKEGQVIHYGEGGNLKSDPSHLEGEIQASKADERFCTRDVDDYSVPNAGAFHSKSDWPLGNYCILRKGGSCPIDFYPGFVQYDDMPQEDGNSNTHTGELPDGVYANDTRIEFCCQYNGFVNDPIGMPASKPFILFQVKDGCQKVEGMHVRKEHYGIDNHNDGGLFAFEGNMKLYERDQFLDIDYCYYTPADMDCGDVITLDEANPQTVIESSSVGRTDMECTWLIKGPSKDGTLLLNFDEFDIEANYGGSSCKDLIEVRHAKIGQKGLIYCGQDDKHTIRSIFSDMMLRFTTAGDSLSHFKATIKWVPNSDLCYNVADKGETYVGKVNYTRIFEPCLPWTEVTHCPHHLWKEGDELDNLEENYCRNPDNSFRPWCYTHGDGCQRNYCDVCKLETHFDRVDDCEQVKQAGHCAMDVSSSIYTCAKTCGDQLPQTGPIKKYTEIECSPPVIPSDGEIVGELQSKYTMGDEVTIRCKESVDVSTARCLSNGEWTPVGFVCLECPVDSILVDDSCYLFKDEDVTYVEAKEICEKFGGHVVMPKTLEESLIVANISYGKSVWIGLTDIEEEGTFKWEDGTVPKWSNWSSGEPNNCCGGEDCTAMVGMEYWNDKYCDVWWASAAVVCSRPKIKNVLCEDYLGERCTKLLTEKPTMCDDHPGYAEEYCTKTCGFCGADNIQCPVKPKSPMVEVSIEEDFIPVGANVTYHCKDKFERIGGSENRACLPSGDLTGVPLECKKIIPCVDVLGDECIKMLTADTGMCGRNQSRVECSKTCGVCIAEGVQCLVQPVSPYVIVSTDKSSIRVGESVQYGCKDGYYKNGGSEDVACLPSGLLTGTPLECEEDLTCTNFLEDVCLELLKEDAAMCEDEFAEMYCNKECGFCRAEGIECPVQPENPDVVASTKEATVTVGKRVHYSCKDGSDIIEGSEDRACLRTGKLTGTPLKCEVPKAKFIKVGVPTVEKGQYPLPALQTWTGENDLWRIKNKGVIVAWEFYSNSPVETAFQVWRVVKSKSKYRLIGQNVLTTASDKKQRYEVPKEEQISVEPGDLIGIASSTKGGVSLSRCSPVDHPTWPGTSRTRVITSLSDFKVGGIEDISFAWGCAMYQFQAEIDLS